MSSPPFAAWHERGKEFYKQKQYADANTCFGRAVACLQQQDTKAAAATTSAAPSAEQCQLLLTTLQNLSAAQLKQQHPRDALLCAAAAAALSCYSSSRAFNCAALALKELSKNQQLLDSSKLHHAELEEAANVLISRADGMQPAASAQPKAEAVRSEANAWRVVCSCLGASTAELQKMLPADAVPAAGTGFGEVQATGLSSSSSSDEDADDDDASVCSSSSEDDVRWLKLGGEAAYIKGLYGEAVEMYQVGLRKLQGRPAAATASTLLSNQSACLLQLQQELGKAAVDAVAAAMLGGAGASQAKALYRAASALLQLGLLPAAAAVCRVGLSTAPAEQEAAMRQLQQRICQQQDAAKTQASSKAIGSGSSTTANSKGSRSAAANASSSSSIGRQPPAGMQVLTELEAERYASAGTVGLQAMAALNARASRAAAALPGARRRWMAGPDTRVPAFYKEYVKAKRLPQKVPAARAKELLQLGYEQARSLPLHMAVLLSSEQLTQQILLQRLGCIDEDSYKWLVYASLGDVRLKERLPYRPGNYQSFTNVAARAELLTPGTTHVAVGFVDLGSLAASCRAIELQRQASSSSNSSSSSSSSSGQPLRWVGYEVSAYAIAKVLVLLQMMKQAADTDCILQAWYSSVWTTATHAVFKAAVTSLTKQQQQQPKDVLQLLQHWAAHKGISLAAARAGWLADKAATHAHIANFVRKADRLALCDYSLTGQLCGATAGDVGSVMMFGVPRSYGHRALNESFLQAVPFVELLKGLASGTEGPDVISAATNILRKHISSLARIFTAGEVTVEVCLGEVEPGAAATIAAIRSLQPYTISWSNVPDYVEPAAFHRLARAVSAEAGGTVHFMHSMNWVQEVKGAFHVHYMLEVKDEALPQAMPKLLKGGQAAVAERYASLGISKLLLQPPVDNPRNVIDYSLFCLHAEGWVQAFFDHRLSGIRSLQSQVQLVQAPEYNVLGRTNSTIHITFTYDPEICFKMHSRRVEM